jgi:hypothetical protein
VTVAKPKRTGPWKAAQAARGLETEDKAMELRKRGASYTQIAAQLGMTKQGVHEAVQRALAKHRASLAESAVDVIEMEAQRLDEMFSVAYSQAKVGNFGAIDRCLSIMSRRAKLLGLDAPDRSEAKVDIDLTDHRPALAALALALPEPSAADGDT